MQDEALKDAFILFFSTLDQFQKKAVLSEKDLRGVRSYSNEFGKRPIKKRN